ncbi:MAG: hypothetical protein KC502_12460, partial [Myxococcales bacterium]|nr:hypothetical protein [Myxococcales bacterium]
MNHALQLTFALLFAALTIGCPGRAPDSTAFAADGGHNDATGGIASDVPAVNDTQTGDSQTADAGPGAADVSTADGGSTPSGVCSGPLPKIFVKTFDSGASERGYGIARHSTGYVIAAEVGDGSYKRQAQLRSISNAGIPQWAKTYGKGGGDETARAVVALKDGFAFAGETNTQGAGSYDGWLVRTDSNGKELWQKTFGGEKTDRFAGLAARKPGGFVAAGTNRSIKGAQEDGWMVATDANGDELWAYGYGGSHIDELFAVVANGDGFAAVGENWSDATSGTDAWLLLVDAKGKTVHSRVYGYGDKDYARGLARTTDGFILTGKASDKGNPKLWIIRTDLTGTQQWARIRGANQSE